MPNVCSVNNCGRIHYARGYCSKHHGQWRRKGRVLEITSMDPNTVIDCGDYCELILNDMDMNEVGRAKIDKEDLTLVQAVGRWGLTDEGYVFNGHNNILLHRLVMNAKENEQVDHKNTGKKHRSDNRKDKLRLCTSTQNRYNQSKFKNNTSGYKGVVKISDNRWRARITINGTKKSLGIFDSPELASEAYIKAAKKFHGSFVHKSVGSRE